MNIYYEEDFEPAEKIAKILGTNFKPIHSIENCGVDDLNPSLKRVSTQDFDLRWVDYNEEFDDKGELLMCEGLVCLWIDGRQLDRLQFDDLLDNLGLSWEEFAVDIFDMDFKGTLVHYTDKRY